MNQAKLNLVIAQIKQKTGNRYSDAKIKLVGYTSLEEAEQEFDLDDEQVISQAVTNAVNALEAGRRE